MPAAAPHLAAVMWLRKVSGSAMSAHRFEAAAGAAHDDRAIAEDATEDRLVDIDAVDLGTVHLERMPAQQPGLVDDAMVGDGEFGRRPPNQGAQPGR